MEKYFLSRTRSKRSNKKTKKIRNSWHVFLYGSHFLARASALHQWGGNAHEIDREGPSQGCKASGTHRCRTEGTRVYVQYILIHTAGPSRLYFITGRLEIRQEEAEKLRQAGVWCLLHMTRVFIRVINSGSGSSSNSSGVSM